MEEIGNELIRIFQLVADVEEETSAALSLLSSLLERFPSAWRECIKPIIYNQTKRAYLCLGVISKIDKQGAIKSKADLDFIVEVAADHGMRAYDLLNYFLLKGIENGAISKPISNEKDYIQNFLSQISYPILEIYQAYKTKPAKAEKLKQRCLDMHLKIIGGDTQAEEKDEFFSAMLMYVFPPAVTTQREEYLRIYQQRSDRPQDIIVLSSNLQNPKPFKVSMGQYILKDYSKPLDETPWKTIKEVVQEVNPEVNPAVSEEEVAALGGELLEHWQKGGSLYQNRKELLNKLYRYFRYSRNATLPDSLDTVQNIMNINQFIGDTLNDLVNECIAQYKDRYPEMYRTVFEKMFPTRVANPQGAAERISEILTKFRDQNEAKTRVAGVLKNMEDHEAFEDIWQKIKDKTSKKEIANILEQVIFKIQPTKTSVVIVQRLQGSEYKAMQSEVSAKYEFSESSESVSLRFIVSKRRAHGWLV